MLSTTSISYRKQKDINHLLDISMSSVIRLIMIWHVAHKTFVILYRGAKDFYISFP